jgi:hypothetical protein
MAKKIMATVDCETDPFSLEQGDDIKPFIWGVYTEKSYHQFYSTLEFVNFIKKKDWNIYAHNGGKFDYIFLLDYLEPTADEYGEKAQPVKVINGRISKFKLGRATFFDSYNILPVPLSAYVKDDFQYWKMDKKHRVKHKLEIEKYLKSDCINLYNFITDFTKDYKPKITLASTAAAQFEKLCEKMPSSDAKYHDKFSDFYYGGRVTPFELGVIVPNQNEEIKVYDINSAYPTAMRFNHPYGTKEDTDVIDMGERLPNSDKYIENCFISLSCETVSVNGMTHGCFPVRSKSGIDFPLGQHDFKVTGWEYLSALKTGAIKNIKIIQVYWFANVRDFSAYVDHFYEVKRDADRLLKECKKIKDTTSEKFTNASTKRLIAKLFLNSQYGKFCQDSRKFKKHMIISGELLESFTHPELGTIDGVPIGYLERNADGFIVPVIDTEIGENDVIDKWDEVREFNNDMYIVDTPLEKVHTFYNIATGASITGWVRAFMWESLCQVERPLYCDTDSIACFGGGALPLGENLGEWDVELENVYKMAIAGKKLYAAFSSDTDKKGVPIVKSACKGVRLDGLEIERVANGEEVLYQKESPVFSISSAPRMLTRYVNRQDYKKINTEKRLNREKNG